MTKDIITAVGRRKTASASVRMTPAKANAVTVNGKDLLAYFKTAERVRTVHQAFEVAEEAPTYSITVHGLGGGLAAQAEALRHAISRGIIKASPELRGVFKKAGLLTRDPRAKERKKPGLKKARKASQWSKR